MNVIIGVDPHKASHTAVALDGNELDLGEIRVRANSTQVKRLLAWAAPFGERTWAVEGAGGCGYLLFVLVRPAAAEHPHPRREGGGHVQHGLAGGDELLGTRTTPGPSLSPRCEHRGSWPCDRLITRRCCVCWPSATTSSRAAAPGPRVGSMRCSPT